MPIKSVDFDITIIGGGLVGLATALSMANIGCSVCLIEAGNPAKISAQKHPSFDDRTLVVNPASREFWQKLGLWAELAPYSTLVKRVHVSQKGRFGSVLFDHEQLNVNHLAHVIEANVLGQTLWNKVANHPKITVSAPAELIQFTSENTSVELQYRVANQVQTHRSQLVVAADGAQSSMRQQLTLPVQTKNYQRTAIIANVTTQLPHNHCAYERLTATGPMALLPFHDRMGLVWTLPNEQAEAMMQLDNQNFVHALQQEMGFRLGPITRLGKRSGYPLHRVKVPQQFKDRVVLMGNAAHTVSPVSAQGLNLAVRGIQRLSKTVSDARNVHQDIGLDTVLQQYQDESSADQDSILQYTDDLMTWFKLDEPLINSLRSVGMLAVDGSQTLKKALYRLAGGLNA